MNLLDMPDENLGLSNRDCSVDAIEHATSHEGQVCIGHFRDMVLHSHFQPIVSLAHRRVVGYEGLLRPYAGNDQPSAPDVLFNSIASDVEVVFLDRLARNIHVRNFMAAAVDESWLFLNVNARVAMRGKGYAPYFESMLARHSLAPHRVVVELIENDIEDEGLLAEAMRYYSELGCLVAIDDFGAGQSNFERIWRVQPQIVKIDRATLLQARHRAKVRRVLPSLVALLHEAGCMTLVEGVEDEEEAMIALDSGADLVQGYYFGKPSLSLDQADDCRAQIGKLHDRHVELSQSNRDQTRRLLDPYIATFRECAGLAAYEYSAVNASSSMVELPKVLRCYLIDSHGRPIGDNVVPDRTVLAQDSRFIPVSTIHESVWSGRPYFQRAIAEPGQIQISRPYFSITDARMCITLSVMIGNSQQQRCVYCADILWEDESGYG